MKPEFLTLCAGISLFLSSCPAIFAVDSASAAGELNKGGGINIPDRPDRNIPDRDPFQRPDPPDRSRDIPDRPMRDGGEGRSDPDRRQAAAPSPNHAAAPGPRAAQPNPNSTVLSPDVLDLTVQIANTFFGKFAVPLTVTSGERTPERQAELMYDMLKSDSSPQGISKYRDKQQVKEITKAFNSNKVKSDAIRAIAKILASNAARGRPISDHLVSGTGKFAFDISTKSMSSAQKSFLFATCVDYGLHCIYEVPKTQKGSAERLVKPFGLPVKEAPAEHLHIGGANAQQISRQMLMTFVAHAGWPDAINRSPLLPAFESATPDFWTVDGEFNTSPTDVGGAKWFKVDNANWLEWRPRHGNIRESVQIWKDRGTEKISGLKYRRLESYVSDFGTGTRFCWIPELTEENSAMLAQFKFGDLETMPLGNCVKYSVAYPIDDSDEQIWQWAGLHDLKEERIGKPRFPLELPRPK